MFKKRKRDELIEKKSLIENLLSYIFRAGSILFKPIKGEHNFVTCPANTVNSLGLLIHIFVVKRFIQIRK